GSRPPRGAWGSMIARKSRYEVSVKGEPDVSALSAAEVALLENVFATRRERDRWRTRDASHKLPEWAKPKDVKSSDALPIEEILAVLGKTEDEIEAVRTRAAETAHFSKIFGS